MKDNQNKKRNIMEGKTDVKEVKLEIIDDSDKRESGEYVEHDSHVYVKHEAREYDELTYVGEGGQVKDERNFDDEENFELRETDTNKNSGVKNEGNETVHEEKNSISTKRN